MISFMQWLMEVGGNGGGGDIPKQCPYDPKNPGGDQPQGSAIRASNLNHLIYPNDKTTQNSDKPPTEIVSPNMKFDTPRIAKMKKKMKS
jgi:hypothetical protein